MLCGESRWLSPFWGEMNLSQQEQVACLAADAAQLLLESGGEIYRVQQTIEHIGKAYGASGIHAYVVPNAIFVSLEKSEGGSVNEMRYVRTRSVHLSRVIAVNALSRRIAGGGVSLEQAQQELQRVRTLPPSAFWLQVLACGVGTACFAYLFGGTAWDAFAAFWVGLMLQPFVLLLARHGADQFISNTLCAVLVATASVVAAQLLALAGISCSLDKIIIGGIIPLVPGIALTNAIRDVANSDYVSGTIRAVEALLIAASIALGVGFVLKLCALIPGVVL